MTQRNKLMKSIVIAPTLNGESIQRKPLIEICGMERVLIENHKGVLQYDKDEITINASYGDICIRGNELELMRMTKEQLLIAGKIVGVQLQERK